MYVCLYVCVFECARVCVCVCVCISVVQWLWCYQHHVTVLVLSCAIHENDNLVVTNVLLWNKE